MIPAANIGHLVLRKRVTEAVEAGTFRVIPITSVDEGIELMTGVRAGVRETDGNFTGGSINALVEARLLEFAAIRKSFASRASTGDEGEYR